MAAIPVVFGYTASGELLIQGTVREEVSTSAHEVHHHESKSHFEAESWSGEHEEHNHHQEERRDSMFMAHESHQQSHEKSEDTPIASSEHFERKRTASLAAALLEIDPRGAPLIHFFHPTAAPFVEAEEKETPAQSLEVEKAGESERVISSLLFLLREMKTTAPDKYTSAVERLRELEAELRTAGAVTPADPAVSDAVARALAAAGPGRDIQIRVNQSRHTTTTKTVYETETPGMAGLDTDKIRELHQQMLASITSGPTDSTADSGTTQKKETAEEGFTNEDGSVVVSKKMTRVVTTTKTTLPGEGEAVAPESPTESLGSVKDRIAKFEQLKEGDRASVTSLASGGSADKEEESKRSSLERIPVDIVVTPVSPLPPGSDEEDEIAETQEPLSPSVEEVSQAEVKSLDSYGEESPRVSEKHLEEEQEPLSLETDRSSTADLVSSDTESARRHKKREILEQSTTTTYGFTTQKEDRRHLQRGDEGEHPEDFAAEEEHGFVKETALESPAGQAPFHRTEVTSVRTEHHEELESPSAADKLKSFAKGAGKVLVAPVALAAAGAVAAYEKLKGESDEEEEPTKEQSEELHLEERQPSLEHPEDERLGTPESQKEDDQEEILRELEEEMEKAEAVKENPIPSKRTSIAEPVAEKESVSPAPIEDHWEVHREPDQVVETTTIRKVSLGNPEVYEYEYPSPVEELPETEELAVPPVQAEEAESPEERNRREIFEQSTTTTYDFTTTHEDRRHLQEGDKEEVPEEHAPVLLTGTPTEVSPHHVVETTKIVKETFDEGAEPHVLETTTISKEYYEEPSGKEAVEPEVEYEERFEEPHRHVETTTIKREYDEEFSEATSPVEDLSGGKVFVTKETFFEPETEHIPVHVVETTTITKEYTESPEHVSPVPIEEHIEVHREPDHIVETTTLRRYSVEEPEEHISHLKRAHEEEDIAGSPAKKTHYYEEEEPESPSAADKLKDFAKGAGKVLVAPVALAAAGALAAYEKLKDQSDEEEEEHHVKKTPEAEELHLEERLSLGEPGKLKEDVSTIVEVGTPESQREVEQEEVLRELEAEMDKEPVEEELESPVTQREIVPESPKELGLGGLEVPEEQLAPSDLASSEDETGPSEKRRPSSDIFYDKPESPVRDRDISPSAGLPEGLESPVVARKEYFHEEVPFSPSVSEKEEPVSPVPGDESEKLIEEPAHIVETTISHRDYYEEPTEEEGPQPGVITEVVEEDIGSFHHVIETTQVQREYHEQPSDLTSSTGSDHDSTLSIKSGQIVHEEPEQRHVVETTTVTKETFYDKNDEQEGEEEQEEHEQPHHIVETTMVSKEYYEEPSRVGEEEPLSPTRSEPIEEFIEVPHRVTFAPEVTKNEAEMVEEEDEHKTCHVVETTTTVKEIYFEEEPKEEELEHLPEEEDHHEKRHVYETTTVTKEVYYEEPEHGEAESSSPAPSPVEEQQPVTRAEYGDEVPSDEESTKDKLLGFAKEVGKVAAGIVAAPVALAAVGAAAAYDKLKGEDQEEDQFAQESPREELEKRRTSHGEPPSAAETPLRETETHEEFVSQEVQNLELPHEPVTESHVEKEPETHEEYVSREVEEFELPHKQFHEEETYVLKSPVRYEKDSETQEELVSRENEELELPHGEVEQETHYKEQSETFEREEHLEVPERPEIEKNEEPAPDTVSRVAEPASPIEEEHLEVPERPEIEKNEEPEPAIVKGQIEDAISPVSVEEPIQLGETITEYHEEKLPSPTSSQKSFEERPHIVETTVVTKEIFYEEPSSPTFSEKGPEEKENVVRDNAREVEIFTSTRDYYDQKEDLPEATDISEEHHKVHETVTTVKETFYEPSSRESPVPSEQESVIERGSFEEEHREPQRVVETTTTVREYFEEPSPSASEKEFPEEPSTEETIIVGEDNEPLRFVETSTTKKEYFEEPTEFLEAPFEHHEPHRVIETMTVTKETYYEEPSTTHEAVTPEDEESTKEKLLSFGKKAGKIAAGIAIAPIALAAVGAQSAYEKLRGDEEEELPFWVDESAAPPSFPPPSYESVEQEDLRWKSLEQPQTVIEHAKEEETESSRDRGHLGLEVLGEQLAPSDLASPEDETGPSEERRPSKNIFYDKPESPVQDRVISPSAGLPEESSSPAASEKEDEGPSVLSALVDHEEPAKVIEHTIEVVSPEKESFEEEEDVIKPHHVVETTIVTKETFLEEPEEKTTEEETEARHVVETTITIKETDFEEPEGEEKDEQDLHRVVETFTTTQEYEQLEPVPEKSTETEEDLHESRYVTETKTVTKESFFDEPKEEVEGAEIPHHVVETTTTTRDIVEEPYISENTEENREKHIVEAIKTTTETYYDKESEDHPSHIKETVVVTKESVEEGESQVVETSTTVKETFFEEPESPTKEEHLETEPEYSIETTVSTKEIHFDEPKEAEHVIESAIYEPEAHHEEPSSPTVKERQFEEAEDYQQGLESPAESDEEATSPAKKKKGLGSKVFGFAKKAGMVVAAPVALAAKGASHAYDALKHKKEGQGEEVMHEGDERVYAFKEQEESGESAEASPETPRKTVEEIHGASSTATFTTETEAEPHVIESTTYEDFSDAAAQAIKVDTVADEEEEDFEGDETHEIASTEYHPAHHEEQIHIEGKTEAPEEEKHVIESETYEDLSERADIPIKIDTVADEEEEAPEEEHREEFIEKEEEHVIPSETHDISAPAYILDDEQPHVIESTTYEDLSDTAVPIKVDTVADEEEEAPEQMSEEIPSVEYHPSHHDEEIHIEGKIESPDEEEYVIESAPYEEYSTVEAVHEPEEFAERRPSVAKREVAEEEEERTSASPVSTDSRIVHEEEREEPVRVETELVEETAPVVSGYTAFGEPINTGLVISAPPSPTEEQELQREQLVSFQERELQEDEEESTKDKIFGFAKDFGQVAAGVVAAPIALAAVGAASAYDALTGQKEEGKTTEEHLMKESPISERESAHGEHFGKESSVKESLPESATPSLEEEEKSHAIESHEAPFEFSPEEERRLTQEIEETSELENRVEEAVRSPMKDVQHRFEQEMEGYEPDEKETHETLFEEQLEKLAEEQGRRSSEELASLAEEYPFETAALAEEVQTKSEEEKALDEETSVEEHLMSPSQDVVVDIEIEEEEIGGRHHIIETTTIRREYDEELSSTESQKELAVEELPAEDAIYHHEIRDEEGHLVETTTITKEYYEEPEEEKESKEREDESEGRHVVETKIVTKESFYDEPETRVEEGLEHERPPHIVETTTVTKEFYEEPEEKKSPEVIEDRFEVHHEPTHVVETTIITKDYYEQPEEEEKAVEEQLETHHEPRHVVETTTITREYYDEAVSPAKEEFEHGLAEEGQEYSQRTEEELHHEKEPVHFTETTSITREYYEPEEKQPPVESEKAVEVQLEAHHEPRHVIETTTITREYFEEPEEQEQSSHKELEQLEETAPVVSGYTASGEPINTGLIISAPPSPAKSLTEEQEESHVPSYEQEHQYHGEEVPSDEESTKDRLLGFAKGVGKVAAGIVVAPVALAAVGAAAAYDKLKGEDHEEEDHEGHLVKEVYTGLPKVSEQQHLLEEPHVIESRETHFEESQRLVSPTTSPAEEERRFSQDIEKSSGLTSETRFEEEQVSHFKESPLEDVQHRFEEEMEGYVPETKETHETIFEEQLEKLAKETSVQSPTKESVKGSLSISDIASPTEEKHVELEEEEKTEAVRKPSLGDEFDKVMEEEWLIPEKLTTEEEVLSPGTKLEINEFVTDVVEEATAGAVIEAAEDLTPRSQRDINLEELALENVARVRYEQEDEDEDEPARHLQSPQKQSEESPSSDQDESRLIAGDDEWKVYDSTGQVVEEFSAQLTDKAIEEAGSDVTHAFTAPVPARRALITQESINEVSMEPETDYQSDLQEKLDILAGQKPDALPIVREEELDVIRESDGESEEHDPIAETASRLVDEVIDTVLEEQEGPKTVTSDLFYSATEKSTKDENYDTCLTSQEDTYESAQGWTSQDSEYTTATSEAPSRLSEMEERTEGTMTPQAAVSPVAVSPVDSDRQFVVDLDNEGRPRPIRSFTLDDETARSTPDVALQITIEEEEDDDEQKMPTSPSGVLLGPVMDVGRPISPVPPRKMQMEDDERAFEFVARTGDKELVSEMSIDVPEQEQASGDASDESARYTRHSSELSSESHADTVIHKEKDDDQLTSTFVSQAGSTDSLDAASAKSTGRVSEGSSLKAEEPAEPIEKDSPRSQDLSPEQQMSPEQISPERHRDLETEEGFVIYQGEGNEGELETVEEEPEDAESLNGGSGSSSANGTTHLGRKYVSSDNVSLTSLQEFERLEQLVANRGDSSLTASEIELYAHGRPRSMEGSLSSLAEFEKLEAEVHHQQANQSPQDEMMLSVVKEESEAEDMSVRDDDEDDAFSETEIKSRPVNEEDARAGTPQALSPSDSLERDIITNIAILETSTDSLEPSYQREHKPSSSDIMVDSLTEYEIVPRHDSTRDSLENIPMDKDSLLEGASQDLASQETHGLLSGDTVGTYQEHDDDDKDSLGGEMESMLRSYPTTLTTFITTTEQPDGSVQTISRRVETRVVDPVMSHVTFTGTESQERLNQLPLEQQIETVDQQGNVTRTLFKRQPPHSE